MQKLTRADLYMPEQYAEERAAFRDRLLAHLKHRCVQLGPHAALHFQDRLTVRYRIQEMLRAAPLAEDEHVATTLATYNPFIPDGRNWKASFVLDDGDTNGRRAALPYLVAVERRVWAKIDGLPPVFAVADEGRRGSADPQLSARLLRFDLTSDQATAVKAGAPIAIGSDHPAYRHVLDPLPANIRAALANDLA